MKMAACSDKKRYGNRMEAEAALGVARQQWRRRPTRAPSPPRRVYQCACGGWHLTHTAKLGVPDGPAMRTR